MEKRVFGIILTVLGIIGIIYAAIHFMNGGSGASNVKGIIVAAIIGAIFFFAGIGLLKNTNDKAS